MPLPVSPALDFELDDDCGTLWAVWDPCAGAELPDRQQLTDALCESGHAALHRDEAAIDLWLSQLPGATEPVRHAIAERRDGACKVMLVDDGFGALLELIPAYGGAAVTRADVDAALAAAGVTCGVLDDAIALALSMQAVAAERIARGRPAVPGEPVRFASLVPALQPRGPRLDARGVADYRELGTLQIVHPGDPLMRRTPGTAGSAGEDVLGRIVPPPAVDETPFAADISGASTSPDDPDLLVADITGQPVLMQHGVSVEPTITVGAVDLASGNIHFDGTVTVVGDVCAGMRVQATGDVFIGGAVEAAQVEAGGNIHIAAGAIGLGSAAAGISAGTRLVAGGSISVLFCENATLDAGVDLLIGEFALHCELHAGDRVIIGKPGARRSQLIGGSLRAASLLKVGVLGSSAGVATTVEVGYSPVGIARKLSLEAEVATLTARMASLQQVLCYTRAMTDPQHREIRERARHSLDVTTQQHAARQAELAEAEACLVLSADPQIVVTHAVHPGVELRIGGRTIRVQETSGAMTLTPDTEQPAPH